MGYLGVLLIAGLIIVGATLWVQKPHEQAVPDATGRGSASAPATTTRNMGGTIEIAAPAPNSLVDTPLHVNGRAKKLWFTNGQFPVTLVDYAGTVIATSTALAATSDDEDFISFYAELHLGTPTTTTGLLILQNTNPTGDPSQDLIFAIPLRFK